MAADILARGLAAAARDGSVPLLRRFADLSTRTIPGDWFEAGAGAERGSYVADALATAAMALAHPLFCKGDASGRYFRLAPDAEGLVDIRQAGTPVLAGLGDNKALTRAAIAYVVAAKRAGARGVRFPAGTYDLYSGVRVTDPDVLEDLTGHVLVVDGGHVVIKGAGLDRTILRQRSPSGGSLASNWQVVSGKVFRGEMIVLRNAPYGSPPADDADLSGLTLEDLTLDGGHPWDKADVLGVGRGAGGQVFPANPADGRGWDITHKGVRIGFDGHVGRIEMSRCRITSFGGEHFNMAVASHLGVYVRDVESDLSWAQGLNPNGLTTRRDGRYGVYIENIYIHDCWQGLESDCGPRGHMTGLRIENCLTAGNLNGGTHPWAPYRTSNWAVGMPGDEGDLPLFYIEGVIANCENVSAMSWHNARLTLVDTPCHFDFSGTHPQHGVRESVLEITAIIDKKDLIVPIEIFSGTEGNHVADTRIRLKMLRTSESRANDRQFLQPIRTEGYIGRGVVLEDSEGECLRGPGGSNFSGHPILFRNNSWRPGANDGAWSYAGEWTYAIAEGATAALKPVGDRAAVYLTSGTWGKVTIDAANVLDGSEITVEAPLPVGQFLVIPHTNDGGFSTPDGMGIVLGSNGWAKFRAKGGRYALVEMHSPTLPNATVANLPPAMNETFGLRRVVYDSTVAGSGNFGAVVAGGGGNVVPVYCDGGAWRVG